MAFTPETKNSGDLIKSQDWNATMDEIVRLETDKVNKAGDTITGSLTINGNVGVGTKTPQAKLEVRDELRVSNDSSSRYLLLRTTGSAIDIDAVDSPLYINNNPSNPDTYIMGGNVGIGTTDSAAKLQILNAAQDANGNTFILGPTASSHLRLGYHTDYSWIQSQGSKPLAINPLGSNVGIGTTSPGAKLEVNGDLKIHGNFLFPNTGKGFASLTNRTFDNESSFQNNNIKFQLGTISIFQLPNTPPLSYEFTIGHIRQGLAVFPNPPSTNFVKVFSINQAGDAFFAGAKTGYVVDHFVNRVGDTLEQGDLVVISKQKVSHYLGTDNNIPIPEVDLTDQAYDSRVCGIVAKVVTEKDLPYVEVEPEAQAESRKTTRKGPEKEELYKHPLQKFAAKFSEKLDHTKVQDKQMGKMVTLGAFAHCKVDADIAPIETGDLLTTSPTKGHAQKVLEPEKAVGAIIGKALSSLKSGKGKIPVLVMLQ